MKYLFLDTNVFIHYIDFEEISWREMLGIEEFCIVITPKVIEEIDKIKDFEKGKKQRKAKTISSKIADVFLDEKKLKVDVKTCEPPADNLFDGVKFQRDISDDSVLLAALQFGCENDDKIVIAADNSILIKAKANGVRYHKMTDEYLLKEELSEGEKKVKSLTERIAMHENRMPKPKILFDNRDTILRIKRPEKIDVNALVLPKINELIKKYPKKTPNNPYSSISQFTIPYTSEKVDYYIKKMQEFYHAEESNKAYQTYMKPINLILTNEGTAQTGDIFVFVNLPNSVNLYNEDCIEDKKFEIPSKPGEFTPLSEALYGSASKWKDVKIWDANNSIESELKLKKTGINHGLSIRLDFGQLYVNALDCPNFSIEYTIHDSKLIEPVTGTLSVVFED